MKDVKFKFTVELKDGKKFYSYLTENEEFAEMYFAKQLISDNKFFRLPDLIVNKDEVKYITIEAVEGKSQ